MGFGNVCGESYFLIMQCKNIPERPILEFLLKHKGRRCFWGGPSDSPGNSGYEHNVERGFPCGIPGKLVRSKMRKLIERGLVSGCACGCRGDFEITEKGEKWLTSSETKVTI